MTNLAPAWRPKRLQNQGRDAKKSMLRNNAFLTSIFKAFSLRFGTIFGRFFEATTCMSVEEFGDLFIARECNETQTEVGSF